MPAVPPKSSTVRSGAVRQQPTDALQLDVVRRGGSVIEQRGHSVAVRPGQILLYEAGRPYRITKQDDWESVVLTLPRSDLAIPEVRLAELLTRPIPADVGPGRILADHLLGVSAVMPDQPIVAHHLRNASLALVHAVLMDSLDVAVEQGPDLLADRLIERITDRLGDPGITLDAVAREVHLSPRSVQRIFAARKTTFSAVLRQARLQAVRRDLADPLWADRPIAALAARSGIRDPAWLSRAFRAEFGLSPREFRRQVATRTGKRTARPLVGAGLPVTGRVRPS